MEAYIAALDQGTTSSRAILFNRAGEIVARAQHPFRQIYPQPGWVEHDPMEIWSTTARALAEAVDSAHIDPKCIAALGITNQRETTILWDRTTGEPVCNAIVWQCRRTAALCEELKADDELTSYIREHTGLPVSRSQTMVVSRWLVIPIAATWAGSTPLWASTSVRTLYWLE